MPRTSKAHINSLAIGTGLVLFGVLLGVTGCATHVQEPPRRVVYEQPAPPVVYVQAPPVAAAVVVRSPGVEIRVESDFYEPLTPYGRWEIVGSYGRCWIPGRVEAGWRPYSNGRWLRTEAGWYWESDEPWGWATYHYGNWDLSPQFGWYWVPRTQWAPAWVSWREGGGYVGWAPLHPSARMSARGSVEVNIAVVAPRAYVFVEPRHFMQPVRPSSVAVNNTTIINKTVNITNVKIVNKTVINEGPRTTVIEQASGQRVQPVAVRELRRKEEAPVATRQRRAPAIADQQPLATPVRDAVPAVPAVEKPTQAEPPRNAGELQRKAQAESRQRQTEADNIAKDALRKSQLESERRVQETTKTPLNEPLKNARALEKNAPPQLEPRTRQAESKATARARQERKDAVRKGAKEKDPKRLEKRPEQTPLPPEKLAEPSPSKN